MRGFQYGYTCPDIDRQISDAKDIITYWVEATYKELNPTLDVFCNLPNEVQLKIDEDAKILYDDLESIFEGVRSINEDMRNEADSQIREALDNISDLEEELRESDLKIDSLENEIRRWEGRS